MAITNKRTLKDKIWEKAHGDFMEKWFYGKGLKFIAVLITCGFLSITNNYQATRALNKMNHLKREIRELKFEQVSISSTLMGESRISTIQHRLKEEQININIPKSAPIILEK